MNRPLDQASIDALAVRLEDYLPAPNKAAGKRPAEPFSKRPEGRDRRNKRRARQAERMAWLNS